MKTVKTSTLLIAVLVLLILCGPAWAVEGMISYWRFDEGSGTTAYDCWGDNDGTIYGAEWTTGIVNSALRFDKNYVEIPDSPSLRVTNNHTVEVWVRPDAMLFWEQGNWGYIVVKQYSPGNVIPTQPIASYGLFIQRDWNPGFHYQIATTSGDKIIQTDPAMTYPIEWYHLVGVYDGTEMRLYMNGVLEVSAPHSGDSDCTNGSLYISRDAFSRWHDTFFKGLIDEVAIYNRALTSGEIAQHYENGLNGIGYPVEAAIDIDPDTLNLKSKGKWVTCYIQLPEECDVDDIDVGTIQLEVDIYAQQSNVQDGILMVKFDRQETTELIYGYLGILGLDLPTDVPLKVTGQLTNGTPFEGIDMVRIIEKGGGKK